MKDSCLHKFTITEYSHRATQFKKIHDALPILCIEKGLRFINNVIRANKELIKTNHLPTYPDETLWSTVVNIEINLVDLTAAVNTQTGACSIIKVVTTKAHDFYANMQKKLLSEYDLNNKIKS